MTTKSIKKKKELRIRYIFEIVIQINLVYFHKLVFDVKQKNTKFCTYVFVVIVYFIKEYINVESKIHDENKLKLIILN